MCGIAGYINKKNLEMDNSFISNAINSIKHRGPDEDGFYTNDKVCLINTRLSIIDLSNGKQPFINDDSSVVVVQNGEIYNNLEIKDFLIKNHHTEFKTNSDTEVILKAYEILGDKCFSHFNGMFSIAIFDARKNNVLLARDRLGVKPLYICKLSDRILFSSEIKTFLSAQDFTNDINNQSIHNYLKFNYIPLPETIFSAVSHVMPGTSIKIDLNDFTFTTKKYWEIKNTKENEISEEDLFRKMDEVLNDAIKIRLRSDVEIGAFLSGGLDSSLVSAMTKKNFNKSLNTFSIGFPEKEFDESHWAKKVADLYDLNNKKHVLDSEIVSLWEKVTWYNDQPHGDVSFIPTFVLSEFASKDYKVVFTGDGGDEFCAGYTKYFGIFENSFKQYFHHISLIKDDDEFRNLYKDNFLNSIDIDRPLEIFNEAIEEVSNKDDINKILYFDVKHLLPGNNLVKPDKMAMANSLETRSPMLDYRFLELMQSIPGSLKLTEQETKYTLKKFALKYLPNDIVYRSKQMFTVPIGEWFKTKLKNYLKKIVLSDSLDERNIFDRTYLEKMVDSHIAGSKDFTRELRAITNLEIWFREFLD